MRLKLKGTLHIQVTGIQWRNHRRNKYASISVLHCFDLQVPVIPTTSLQSTPEATLRYASAPLWLWNLSLSTTTCSTWREGFFSPQLLCVYKNLLWPSLKATMIESCSPCLQYIKMIEVKTEDFPSLWSMESQARLLHKI